MERSVINRLHAESLQKFVKDATVSVQAAYYEGYAHGKEDGWDAGWDAGYGTGWDDGFFERQADKRHDAEDERP